MGSDQRGAFGDHRLAARRAVQRARQGDGPTFIEAKTMRMHGHSEHDSAKYVPRELIEEWTARDPIVKAEKLLAELGYADEAACRQIEERVAKEIDAAVEFGEQSPLPEGREALEGVFALNGEVVTS